jgi:nucleoside-diphosphate-sugar epimerase
MPRYVYYADLMRILVTGATGFVGRQTLPFLLDKGYEVHATYAHSPLAEFSNVTWHRIDLLHANDTDALIATLRASHLLHLAWYVNPKDYKNSVENDRWRDATIGLFKAFVKCGGVRATVSGTAMEYGASPNEEKLHESSAVNLDTIYAKAKHETRVAIEKIAQQSGVSLAWARVFNLYGPYESPGRLVPHIIRSLLRGVHPELTKGDLTYDYSYVLDSAGALVALLASDVSGIVNIGSGKAVTLQTIAKTIAEIMGRQDLIPPTLSGGNAVRIVADVERLNKEVGWTPHYTLRQGLEETVRWWERPEGAFK